MKFAAFLTLFAINFLLLSISSADTPIKIGVIAPLSGPAAELGIQIKNGLELSKLDHKSLIEFVYEDGACDAKTALTAARKLSSMNDVPVVIGPLCSPPFLAVAPMLNSKKIAFIHSSSGTQNTSSQKGAFGIEGTATVMEENAFLAKHVKNSGYKNAAVIHFEQEWASGHANAFVDAFTAEGGKIVAKEAFTNVSESDFRPYILRVRAAKPDAIFIAAFNGQTGTILKQLRSSGVKTPVFAQYDVEDPAFLDAAGVAANGVQYSYPFDNTKLSEKALAFQKLYRERFDTIPSFYPYNGYDIAMLVDRAVLKCGTDSKCIREHIAGTKNFIGLTGEISFSDDGNISRNFMIKEVDNMKFRKVG